MTKEFPSSQARRMATSARQLLDGQRRFMARIDDLVSTSSDPSALLSSANAEITRALEEEQALANAASQRVALMQRLALGRRQAAAGSIQCVGFGGGTSGNLKLKSDGFGFSAATGPSMWFVDGEQYGKRLHQDLALRAMLKKRLYQAGVSRIIIEHPIAATRVTVYAGRPGLIMGKNGADLARLRQDMAVITQDDVCLCITQIRTPQTDAQLVAEVVARRLELQVDLRRAMRRSILSAVRQDVKGVRINLSRQLERGGFARMEWHRDGRAPLHTRRAEIDYGFAEAKTIGGVIGVKTWIFRDDPFGRDRMSQDMSDVPSQSTSRGAGRERGDDPYRRDRGTKRTRE